MTPNPTSRTRRIGVRAQETVFEQIRDSALSQGKTVSEWCSDRLAEIIRGFPSVSEQAVLAEMCAIEAILIDMLCALGRDGKITTQKAQEIVDRAHNEKYKDARRLLSAAHSRAVMLRPDVQSSGSS